jgi:hypothetical protein
MAFYLPLFGFTVKTNTASFPQNPSVKKDCSGIKVGNSYCIEINGGDQPITSTTSTTIKTTTKPTVTSTKTTSKTTTSSSTTTTTTSSTRSSTTSSTTKTTPKPTVTPTQTTTKATTTTGTPKPSPTQSGLTTSCIAFYKAVSGDTCAGIVNAYGGAFSLADFYAWNPYVNRGGECMSLWADTYYCVGVPGTATTRPPPAGTTPTGCTVSAPASTQPGSACGCKRWHLVADGDTCQEIMHTYGLSESDFLAWNTKVGGHDCRSLWKDYRVCVGM